MSLYVWFRYSETRSPLMQHKNEFHNSYCLNNPWSFHCWIATVWQHIPQQSDVEQEVKAL